MFSIYFFGLQNGDQVHEIKYVVFVFLFDLNQYKYYLFHQCKYILAILECILQQVLALAFALAFSPAPQF